MTRTLLGTPDPDDKPSKLEQARAHFGAVAEAAHDAIAGKIDARKKEHLADTLERFERELVPHVAPFVQGLAENENLPDELRQLFQAITQPEHFTQSILLGIGVGALVSPVLGTASAPFVQQLANEVWPHNTSVPLSPSLLAESVIKGVETQATAATEAALSGISDHRFDIMVKTAGQGVAIEAALLLWRRGQIDEAELDVILRYSNIRPQFFADVKKLRYAPPSAAEAIAGVVEGHLSEADGKKKFVEAGQDPVNFDWVLQTAGRPPATEQMLHLLNRGLMTEDEVRAAIRESNIKNKYIDQIIATRVYLPPPRSIVPMLRSGAITEARARELFIDHGLSEEDTTAFIKEAKMTKTGAAKELTASQVTRAYEERLLDEATAHQRIVDLGYPDEDATLFVQLADDARERGFRSIHITRIHEQVKNEIITPAVATAQLAALGLPAPAVTDLVTTWTDQIKHKVVALSLSQVQGAMRRGMITLEGFIARAHTLGFKGKDVQIVAAEAYPPGQFDFMFEDKPIPDVPDDSKPLQDVPLKIAHLDIDKL